MFVHAKNGRLGRQCALQDRQPALAEVAEPGVVRAALCVVVMRYHGDVKAQNAQQVKAVQPVRVSADLVHLVDGQRPVSHRGGCG